MRSLDQMFSTVRTATVEAGHEMACAESPDVIAIDLSTTSSTAWTMCRVLKADPRTADIPVVILARDNNADTIAHAGYVGASIVALRDDDDTDQRDAAA